MIQELWNGRVELVKSYWGYGMLGSLVWGLLFTALQPGTMLAVLALVAACIYFIVVGVGIWRAAGAYTGAMVWRTLGRIAGGLGLLVAVGMLAATLIGAASQPATPTQQRQALPLQNNATTAAPSVDYDGKRCSEITEFLGECKR